MMRAFSTEAAMDISRITLVLLTGVAATACASWESRQQGMRETDRMRDNERRYCMTQPPAQVEACLRRVEEDYVARENMRKLEPRTEREPPPPRTPPAAE
jgi:hypothetical protein